MNAQILARLFGLIGIGKSTLTDDTGEAQLMQISEGARGTGGTERITDQVPRMAEYGFASNLPDGAEVLVIRRDGERGKPLVIATQHRASRPTGLPQGDVWLYDDRGRRVKLTADGVEVDAGGGKVTVTNASKVRCECDIETTGDVVSRCDGSPVSLGKLHDAYNAHTHPPRKGSTDWGTGVPDRQA